MPNRSPVRQLDFLLAPMSRPTPIEMDTSFFLREMHHRLANSLTLLAAILRRELRSSAPLDLQASLDRCEARMVALSNLHRFLIVGAESGWIPVQFYLEQLCEALTEAILKPFGICCEVASDAAFFPSKYCELLGLMIAELVTNAAKHAFGGRDDGMVRIELVSTTDTWTCMVSDNGRGVSPPSVGAGSRIIATLLDALGADIATKSGTKGTSVAITCQVHPEFYPAVLPETLC